MQLNPDKECVKKGIFDIFFKQLSAWGELNKLAVDFCIYQQNTKDMPWFMIEANKNDDAIDEFNNAMQLVKICNKKLESAEESIAKIVQDNGELLEFNSSE